MKDSAKYEVLSWVLDVVLPAGLGVTLFLAPVGLTTYVHVGPLAFHAYTVICLILAYFVAVIRLEFLSIPWREVVACGLVVAGVHLYDTLWAVASIAVRGGVFPLSQVFGLAFTLGVLAWLDSRLLFLKLTKTGYLFFCGSVLAFVALATTGFYQAMTLYDTAGGPDPSNWVWALGKLVTLMVLVNMTMRGGENQNVRLSLA